MCQNSLSWTQKEKGAGGACSGGDQGEQGQGCGGYTCLGSCSPQ